MQLYDHELRLIAANHQHGFVWSAKAKQWRPIEPVAALNARAHGETLTADQAAKRFPGADIDGVADLPFQ